jgi:hypothetical protein
MPDLVRVLRKTYGRLHAEGHVNNKTAILVRVGEKLILWWGEVHHQWPRPFRRLKEGLAASLYLVDGP